MADRCEECWHATDLHAGDVCKMPGCGCGAEQRVTWPTWAVVPSRERPEMLLGLVASLAGQVEGIVFVDNADEPRGELLTEFGARGFGFGRVIHLHRPGQPPHLYRLYNQGMDAIDDWAVSNWHTRPLQKWNVCLLNDDVTCPPGWAYSLERELRETGAALAYTDRLGRAEPLISLAPPQDFNHTATLWAAMLRGEAHVRYDETFRWWYGDNDIDLRCRLEHGGTVAVPGPQPTHHAPSQTTLASQELSRIANQEDAPAFDAKWAARLAAL